MAETANIAAIATDLSDDIFKWFGWERIPTENINFPCHKVEKHTAKHKNAPDAYKHPVDVVFKYLDPYLNKIIYLSTDLKSLNKDGINTTKVKEALVSLAKTLDCAKGSPIWNATYVLDEDPHEIRALLFLFNHDDEYKGNFQSVLSRVDVEKLGITHNDIIHVIDPARISYLNTVVTDIQKLQGKGEFPKRGKYSFLHPELVRRKPQGDKSKHPATVEALCSPYMIIEHESVSQAEGESVGTQEGYLIYYNQEGSTHEEFMYLFDALSHYQILSSTKRIRLRVAHKIKNEVIMNNFQRAKNLYVADWNLDKHKKQDIDRISIHIVQNVTSNYNPGVISWRVDP